MTTATPIRRRKLYEDVSARIEEMIRDGRFAVGDQLPPERELATEFGVGRSAVREAIFWLHKMGLVAVSSGERARVISPSPETIVGQLSGAARLLLSHPDGVEQFQDARLLFEVGLARRAAQVATEEDLERLREALEANRASISSAARFQRTDIAFHYAIAVIPGNKIFTSLHEAVVEWLMEQRVASTRVAGASEAAYAAHERIYAAIAAHDTTAAQNAMEEHLNAVKSFYWQAIRANANEQ